MASLLFTCPTTHQQAPTGIETDVQSLQTAWKATLKIKCPHCGAVHEISVQTPISMARCRMLPGDSDGPSRAGLRPQPARVRAARMGLEKFAPLARNETRGSAVGSHAAIFRPRS
jgi:hypothetical protein